MKYECTYNYDLNIIEVVTHGLASAPEMIDMINCIVKLCAQNESANIIIDHTKLNAGPLRTDDMYIFSDQVVSNKDILKTRMCAQVSDKDFAFGLLRAYQILNDISGLSNFHTMVFTNITDAIAWVKAGSLRNKNSHAFSELRCHDVPPLKE